MDIITRLSLTSAFVLLFVSASLRAQQSYEIVPGKTEATVQVQPSGALNYSVPLSLPIGTNGVQPNIALVYSSVQGDGVLGRGWTISGIGGISRCGSTLAIEGFTSGIRYDSTDKFCLNGQRLVLTGGAYGQNGSEYRTEIDKNYRVIAHGAQAGSPTHFEVKTPDGRTFWYGMSDDSRVELQFKQVISYWALSKIVDIRGNYIEFLYQEKNESGEFYPAEIKYTGNDSQQLSPYNSIKFHYEGRPDPFYSCALGSLTQTAVRLREIEIKKHIPNSRAGDTGSKKVFRRYFLDYEDVPDATVNAFPREACLSDDNLTAVEPPAYQRALESRFASDSVRLARLARYDDVEATLVSEVSSPSHMELRLLLDSQENPSDASDPIYDTLLNQHSSNVDHFEELADSILLNSGSLDSAGISARLAELDALEAALEAELGVSEESLTELEGELQALEGAREGATSVLIEYLRAELKRAQRILLVHGRSTEKKELFNNLRKLLKIKYRASKRAADDCLALAQGVELDPLPDEGVTCTAINELEAGEKFLKYAKASTLYFDLFEDVSSLETQVIYSETDHYHHLLVAGQIVNVYERFAEYLLAETEISWDSDIASVTRKIDDYHLKELNLLAGVLSPQEEQLRDTQFEREFLQAHSQQPLDSNSVSTFVEAYLGAQIDEISNLYAIASNPTYEYLATQDTETEVSDIVSRLQVIANFDRQESYVNYQAILDHLMSGGDSQLIQLAAAGTTSILGESRVASLIECGTDDSCYAPIEFKWNPEIVDWLDDGTPGDSVPDTLISHDIVRSSLEGLVVDAGALGDGSDGSNPSGITSPNDLSGSVRDLGRQLAESGQVVDVNGDGLDDWVLAFRGDDGAEYLGTWLNNGDGWLYSNEHTLPVAITNSAGLPFGQFIDLNGDGLLDWIGSVEFLDGTTENHAYLNTSTGWDPAPEKSPTFNISLETAEGHVSFGQFIRGAAGELYWYGADGDDVGAGSVAFVLDASGWLPVATPASFNLAQNSSDVDVGAPADVAGDGTAEWMETFAEADGTTTLRAWELINGEWVRLPSFDVTGISSDVSIGEFVDFDGDGLLDWVLSEISDAGVTSTLALVNTGAGWQESIDYMPPATIDESGNQLAQLFDLNGDGFLDWVQGVLNADGSTSISAQLYDTGAWQSAPDQSFPFYVSEFLDVGTYAELGEFANFAGTSALDWLNQSTLWHRDQLQTFDSGESLVFANDQWAVNASYRLPVLEANWLGELDDLLVSIQEGYDPNSANEGNLIATVESSESGGSNGGSSGSSEGPSSDIPDGGVNAIQSGRLVDVNGDGRLDWVKSIRFSAAASQQVVWLRTDSGWSASDTFVPPTPLVDFTAAVTATIVDFDSDGLPDFLSSVIQNGTASHQLWRNTGENWVVEDGFDLPHALVSLGGAQPTPIASLIDINADGRLDIMVDPAHQASGVAPVSWLNKESGWEQSSDLTLLVDRSKNTGDGWIASGQFVDINSDGLPDWVEYSELGDRLWIHQGESWEPLPDRLPISVVSPEGDVKAFFADVNGDGLKDLLLAYWDPSIAEQRNSWLFNGSGFKQAEDYLLPGTMFYKGKGRAASLLDINADGYLDFVQSVRDALIEQRSIWLGSADGWEPYSDDQDVPVLLAEQDTEGFFRHHYVLADIDGDHQVDFVPSAGADEVNPTHFGRKSVNGFIREIYDSARRTEINLQKGYKPYSVVSDPVSERATYPLITTNGPSVIVAGVSSYIADALESQASDRLITDVSYSYGDFAYDLTRHMTVGSGWSKSVDWSAERVALTSFRQDFPFVGQINRADLSHLWGNLLKTNHYGYQDLLVDEPGIVAPFLFTTIEVNYKEDGSELNSINRTIEPDAYGYVDKVTEVLSESGREYHTVTEFVKSPDISRWNLDRFQTRTIKKWTTDHPVWQSVITNRGYNVNGLMKSETTSGLKHRFIYDAFGNVKQKISGEGSSSEPRNQYSTFDAKGRFLIERKNVLGELTQLTYVENSDSPSKIVANDGLYTEFSFDGFGRKIRESSSNEIINPFAIRFCTDLPEAENLTSCPEDARYVTIKFSNESKGSAAESVYYDRIGRELRRATASAGSVVYLDTEYNFDGSISRRSVPYDPSGEDVPLFVKFVYDVFGRTAQVQQPGERTKSWVYDGRTTIEYDELSNPKTTIKTPFGEPEEIIDAYGYTTKYKYNALGQLKLVEDAEENSTQIFYDALGNKEVVIDPDHGRTEFSHNVFGQVTLKTDVLGNSEEFIYDAVGRKEQRIDRGVDSNGDPVAPVTTTWTYFDLNESRTKYLSYLDELTEGGASQEIIDEINEIVYLNPNAATTLVKSVTSSTGYEETTTYDYRARQVENTVELPDGQVRALQTTYLGESLLPNTVRYPNNFSVRYEYDDFGYLKSVKNGGLNTLDHYSALIDRASFMQSEVAPAVWAKANTIKVTQYDPAVDRYEQKLDQAKAKEDEAILHAKKANNAIAILKEDYSAIDFLQGELLSVTGASSRGDRDGHVTRLQNAYSQYLGNGFTLQGGCQPAAPHVYELELYTPVVYEKYELEDDPESQPVYEGKITRTLPTVCTQSPTLGGYPTLEKLHHKTERQVVDLIIGLMNKLRERRPAIESRIDENTVIANNASTSAIALYSEASAIFDNEIRVYAQKISDLNKGGNEVMAKAFDVYAKAARVYQFYEVEREVEFWTAEESDEVNRVVTEIYGNGTKTERTYNKVSGYLERIHTVAENDDAIQDDQYFYDVAGNLRSRVAQVGGTVDTFSYDKLNRVETAKYSFVSSNSLVEQEFSYDSIGNIKQKSDIGTYSYAEGHPHAVSAAGNRTYAYDLAGRMTDADDSTIDYTTFSKPQKITESNGDFTEYKYGPSRSRWYERRVEGGQVSENFYFFRGLYEESVVNGQVTQQTSVGAGGKNIAVIQGYEEVFESPDELPELGSAAGLAAEIASNINMGAAPLAGVFNAFDNAINDVGLIAGTSSNDLTTLANVGDCREIEEGQDPNQSALRCLTEIQIEEAQEVVASALINIQYLHYDNLDSVRLVTDGQANILAYNYYDAFGRPIVEPDNGESDAALGGHERVAGMDLVHMNGRVYDPNIGRFLSADPFVPSFLNPQSLNRYSYVYNNPLRYVDPNGYEPVTASQHERNEYIFVSLSYFYLEIVLPSERHLYDLLELSRNDPGTFAEHITAWGSSPDAWQIALPFIEAGQQTAETVKAIRDAERDAKYLTIASAVVVIATSGSSAGWFGGTAEATLGSVYAPAILNAGAQLAITGDLDLASTALSIATAYVGSANLVDGIAGITGFSAESLSAYENFINYTAQGLVRGFGSHLSGGEFEHGFFAGVAEAVLNDHFFEDPTNEIFKIIRSGVIEGIVTEIANETRNGERLDFFDGFQLGVLREGATQVGILIGGGETRIACDNLGAARCNLSSVGDALNLLIEGGDTHSTILAVLGAGFSIHAFRSEVVAFVEQFGETLVFQAALRLEENSQAFFNENDGEILSEESIARNEAAATVIEDFVELNGLDNFNQAVASGAVSEEDINQLVRDLGGALFGGGEITLEMAMGLATQLLSGGFSDENFSRLFNYNVFNGFTLNGVKLTGFGSGDGQLYGEYVGNNMFQVVDSASGNRVVAEVGFDSQGDLTYLELNPDATGNVNISFLSESQQRQVGAIMNASVVDAENGIYSVGGPVSRWEMAVWKQPNGDYALMSVHDIEPLESARRAEALASEEFANWLAEIWKTPLPVTPQVNETIEIALGQNRAVFTYDPDANGWVITAIQMYDDVDFYNTIEIVRFFMPLTGGDAALELTGFGLGARLGVTTGQRVLGSIGDDVLSAANRTATPSLVNDFFQTNRRFWADDPIWFEGNKVFQRNDLFDPNHISSWVDEGIEYTGTNIERMAAGRAPIAIADGKSINLHHMIQTQDGAIAEMTNTFHFGNYGVIHINTGSLPSGITRSQWDSYRARYWKKRAEDLGG